MSFGGAECSSSGNPLSQFQKHVQGDTSLQNDRLGARGPVGAPQGFRSAGAAGPQQDEMVNGFLNQQPGMGPQLAMPNGMLQIDPLTMRPMGIPAPAPGPMAMAPQMMQAPAHLQQTATPGFSATEFAAFNQNQSQAVPAQAPQMQAQPMMQTQPFMMTSPMGMGMGMGMGMNMGMAPMMMNQPMQQQQQQQQPMAAPAEQQADVKGKGKAIDDEQWEDMFKQIDLQEQKASSREEELAAERELEELDRGMTQDSETNYGDFEAIWRGIQAEKEAAAAAEKLKENLSDSLGADWDQVNEEFSKFNGDWNHYAVGEPVIEKYMFEEDNIFSDKNNAFEEGVKIMKAGGNLSLAALAFEAAVQQNPGHVQAWVYLGNAQAQNEKETAAIRAHEQALKLDPNNLTALMGLAVSYINEGYESTAYRTLERWLSVKYPQIVSPDKLHEPAHLGFTERELMHTAISKLFMKAARLSPNGAHMDPDVQVGLGVLFYGSDDFEKAIDCFQAALSSVEVGSSSLKEEQEHLLWNRLGATLANSGRSEDAIVAYQNALSLQPNFVRARYNLGVSCINMGCLEEAAQHFLLALDMHKAIEKEGRTKAHEILGDNSDTSKKSLDERLNRISEQNQSTALYDTLRRVFTQMNRMDLAQRVVTGVDPESFLGDIKYKQ
ncbi:hypothetical protein TD95_001751 [Thielaviopsis punctulata]|uniref:Peroxisomal targeting signal receptor n=1 Tax=Thielaviopsis punctulata TaxID=72032 RepID=A0A0F4Z8A5_9PEZI|nr:hypothetical protein TD95_001751 [Thielaviopsis punctulata]